MSRIPKGCDQQGRHPEAAHCVSEFVAQDDDEEQDGIKDVLKTIARVGVVMAFALLFS
jgi:hypothetical protein